MWKAPVPLLLLTATALGAQGPRQGELAPNVRRVVTAAPAAGQIRLDGLFDEPAWAAAETATDFTQAYPNPGAPATERTEVRIVVGADALYVAARMFDSRPDSIAAQLSRRDVGGTYSDRVLLYVDSHNDRRTSFHFGVNPRGVKTDSYQFDDRRDDASWDAVWDVATTVDSLGWTAEFRIPLSQLRFSQAVNGRRVWGFGVMRDIARREERSTWSPWTRNSPGFVSSYGELAGLDQVRAPKRLEILPYTSARLERAPGDRSNPFYHSNDVAGSMGADIQYGLPGGLTLTGTLNPDFGQVEVDPAVVNLTAFETRFEEKRPFFVAGGDIFRFGNIDARNSYGSVDFFYSRRIGRTPQRVVGGSLFEYVDTPEASTILGAAKISGKTAGGWSVGLMDAVTGRERASTLDTLGIRGTSPVEPLTNYFVGRLRRDLGRGNTVLGGIFTATNRDMSDELFAPLLRSSAYLAGVDGQHSWNKREWTLSGYFASSQVLGSAPQIASTQRSSARYYQRPDADHLDYDPERSSLGGHIGAAALSHTGKWDGSVAYQETSPGFEVNDLGFQGAADRRALSTYMGRRVNKPGKLFRSYSYSGYTTQAWNFGGDNVFSDFGGRVDGSFKNFWFATANFSFNPEYTNDRLTRGGPLARVAASNGMGAYVSTDRRKRLSGDANVYFWGDRADQSLSILGTSLSLRPSTTLQVSFGPTLTRERSTTQFILSRADSLVPATFGRRYVFADVDRSTLSLDTRVSWTLSPTLSLQVFAQPFLSSGDFENYKEFLAPGTYDFGVYGRDRGTINSTASGYLVDPDGSGPAGSFSLAERDFTFRSLRGNAVLRWEYRPGSTLFFVWQQRRSGQHVLGDLDLARDGRGIFDEPAQNVFMIKATYWIGQ
jgi:hypothetical protein